MTTLRLHTHGHPVLIIGAGRGGTALLEMFLDDPLVEVVGVADMNPAAPGMALAREHDIATYVDPEQALRASKVHPDCVVYNLTHDDAIADAVRAIHGSSRATGGTEAKLIWQMVTKLKRITAELEASQNQLKAIFDNAMDGIITLDGEGRIQGCNRAAEKIFGYGQLELLGRDVTVLMPAADPGQAGAGIARFLDSGRRDTVGISAREMTGLRKDGQSIPVELSASEMQLEGRRYFIGIVRDIAERKLAEQRIQHMAHHDFLTQLPNRALFMDRLAQALARAQREDTRRAVLFLDLDGFKSINDAYGHEAGDQLLQQVAQRLQAISRKSDTVARMGGDEFTFVLERVGGRADVELAAARIIDSLAGEFDIAGRRCRIGGSIGAAIFPDDSKDRDGLLRLADDAMYVAKQGGKNSFRLAQDTMGPLAGRDGA